jgi:hypothetical protein
MHFDANFKLTLEKREKRTEQNTRLSSGAAFFVETDGYQKHLATAQTLRAEVSRMIFVA